MKKIRSAAFIPSDQMSNSMDHLAVICYIMKIPLILGDPQLARFAKRYYPQITWICKFPFEMSMHYIADQFDLLFVSYKLCSVQINFILENFYRKKMHFFYCPHGNSDKGHLDKQTSPFLMHNMGFIYGKQMEENLKKDGIWKNLKNIVTSGNYRRHFYHLYKDFYDTLIIEEVLKTFDPSNKTILYAPTWNDQEGSSSFFDVCSLLLKQLPDAYNLIIKLHPYLEHHFPAKVHALIEKNKNKKNVRFLLDFPLVYPLFHAVDIYLGDFSSVGYDFLSENKPMFFFNPKERKDKGCLLHSCGKEIPKESYGNIFSFIESSHTYTQKRKELYDYAFGPLKDFSELKTEVEKSLLNCL